MKACALKTWVSMCLLLCAQAILAQGNELGPLSLRGWLLVDLSSGRTLSESQATAPFSSSAYAPLMVAQLSLNALQAKRLSASRPVAVSEAVQRAKLQGSSMYIDLQSPPSVAAALDAVCVLGARDASAALMESLTPDPKQQAAMMNAEAQRLGMRNTRYSPAWNSDDEAASTNLEDQAKLAAALMREHPQARLCFSQRSINTRGVTQHSDNRLLWLDPSVEGLMLAQGREREGGQISLARRGDRQMLALVWGARDAIGRGQASLNLLNYGFQAFDAVQLYAPRQAVRKLTVWQGVRTSVDAGFPEGLVVTVPRDRAPQMRLVFQAVSPLRAPVAAGDVIGSLRVSLDQQTLGEYPVVALSSVPTGNFLRRAWDAWMLWLR